MAGKVMTTRTRGAWTTASTPVPPTAPPPLGMVAAATAIANMGMMTVQVSEEVYLIFFDSFVFLASF